MHGGIPHLPRLPLCQWAAKLPHPVADGLRDAVQEYQHTFRVKREFEVLKEFKTRTGLSEEEQHAFNTTLTLEQLTANVTRADKKQAVLHDRVQRELSRLVAEGLIAKDQASMDHVSHCLLGRLNPHLYAGRPVVSFLVQYYKRPWMIPHILEPLLECNKLIPIEVVVNVDSLSEGAEWAAAVKNTSGVVVPVFSANVHEIRAYNRIAEVARGKYLIIHQDDQTMPRSCKWLPDLVENVLDRYPQAGIVGLKGFIFNHLDGNINAGQHFIDPVAKVKVHYAANVDFAPMAIRKSAFKHVGGLDESLSEQGECGIWSDWEISSRMWAAGWQVMYTHLSDVDVDRSGKPSGTHTPTSGHRCWGRQQHLASSVYWIRWNHAFQEDMGRHVVRLLHEHMQPIYTKCPISPKLGGCKMWADSGYGNLTHGPGWPENSTGLIGHPR